MNNQRTIEIDRSTLFLFDALLWWYMVEPKSYADSFNGLKQALYRRGWNTDDITSLLRQRAALFAEIGDQGMMEKRRGWKR